MDASGAPPDAQRGWLAAKYFMHARKYPGDYPDASKKVLSDLRHEEQWTKEYYITKRHLEVIRDRP